MKIKLKYFTQEIRDEYDIMNLVENGYVYIEIRKVIYGLKEERILAFNYIVQNLATHGYHHIKYTAELWEHKNRNTEFVLCIDDFDIKYDNQDDLDHLLIALQTEYEISTDYSGRNYIGLTIDWKYSKSYDDISMLKYIMKALQKILHIAPTRNQHAPHRWTESAYGQKVQYDLPECTLSLLDKKWDNIYPGYQWNLPLLFKRSRPVYISGNQ